ncbi:anthrax toxin-like adenylyl cyclase domain-containing protein [Xenorhabdus sp. PR6a]|uniref:anthrax toxin-like adenylyl cyclase domain-containing protein n=1 Tax=Xenorhabdus sp. PR6a TaxID=3025877 RepID=UPI002358594C|nr:anthrax toxin-like adenylyl cyclase domain-containing protein [Xenorhabdus sp. PR6a]MDC9580563.1 anthrax toxin-like adenylyl cyclase domain-containing protein [Xenorhabdus sp. PR6a]
MTLNDINHQFPPSSSSSDFLYYSAFLKMSKKYNVIIGIREPNPHGEELLINGYPSKNFHMKAKSSSTGPTAGFITEDATYSKVSTSSYDKQNKAINDAKARGARAVNLMISKERIDKLCKAGELKQIKEQQYSAVYPGGEQKFFIEPNGGLVLDVNKNVVKVMTNPPEVGVEVNPHENLPIKIPSESGLEAITADYDLFAIIPRKNQDYNIRPLQVPPKRLKGNSNLDFLKPKIVMENGQHERTWKNKTEEHGNMGNVHCFGMTIINALNKEIKNEGYKGGKLVWHNDETGNPYGPGFDAKDRPIFFLPNGHIFQAHSKYQVIDFYRKIKELGFSPEYNPIFGF